MRGLHWTLRVEADRGPKAAFHGGGDAEPWPIPRRSIEASWVRLHALLRDLERDPQARFEQRFAFHFGETPQTYLERWYYEIL